MSVACSFNLFAVGVGLLPSIAYGQGVPGAEVPWTTYEAEKMTTTGTILGPGYAPNTVEAESSGRQCVELSNTGQYVQFTAQAAANSIVVRYSVPDTSNGGGANYTLDLYINGTLVKALPVTSMYSWLYGGYPFSNTPQYSPRNFYDEVRLFGVTINSGDTITIKKDSGNTAAYYMIDLVDLEQVGPALTQPANSLSVKSAPYNAAGNGTSDDTTAIQDCINDAESQGKIVWIPPGNYMVDADLVVANVTIQGAGMWYTTLVGNPAVYNSNVNGRVRFDGNGNNINMSDFAIVGCLNYRGDSEANDGLQGFYGTGSSIRRCWVEHTKTGFWIANSSGLVIDSCRVRDTIADGYNLAVGVQNTIVTNCTARGVGDDCFAMWPTTYTSQTYVPGGNIFTHDTGGLNFLANGGSLYGGINNGISGCLFQDMPYGCGVLISGTFPIGTNVFAGTTLIQNCNLVRAGGYDPSYQWRAAFQFTMDNNNISGVIVSNINIVDSVSDGMSIISTATLTATVDDVNIPDFGLGALGRHAVWATSSPSGGQPSGTMTINNSTLAEAPRSDTSNFHFVTNNVTILNNVIPVVPINLNATLLNQGSIDQVTLSWQASQFATSYHVKRSTSSGGPYTTIATTTTSGYLDTSVSSGTTYYYVVSGVNANGESANSSQVTPASTGGALTFSSGTYGDNTVLSLIGGTSQELYGVSLGSGTAETTANGYNFGAYPDGNITYGDSGSGAYGGFLSGATTGDSNFNNVLNNAELGLDNGTLVLQNLTSGTTYNVLFLMADTRNGVGARVFNITSSGSVQSPNQQYAFQAGTPAIVGGFVLCTFTATGSTATFTTAQQTSYQLNGVIVGTAGSGGGGSPPAPPTGLGTVSGNGQVTFMWSASSGATSYNVKRSTVSGGPYTTIANTSNTSYTDTSVTNGTTYYYVVSALNGSGESANSSQISGTPLGPPSTPTGLSATAGNAQVALSWNTSSGATSYNVQRSTTSGSGYTTIASPSGTSYTDTGVTNGTTYYYVVSAVNSYGQSANSGQVSATPTSGSGGGITFSNGTFTNNSVLSLVGTEVYGVSLGNSSSETTANGYTFSSYPGNISYGSGGYATSGFLGGGGTTGDSNFNAVLNNAQLGIGNGVLTLNNLTSGTTYTVLFLEADTRSGMGTRTFQMTSGSASSSSQSYAFQGGSPSMGGYVLCTFTATGTTQTFTNTQSAYGYQLNGVLVGKSSSGSAPGTPTGLSATAGNAQVALSWNASSGASSYNIKRSTTSGSGYVTISSPTGTSYTDTSVTNGTTYYYVVSAVNSFGESANSSQVSATPGTAPGTPTGLSATAGNAQVALSWNASSGASSYNIKRSTTSGSGYVTISSPTGTSFTDTSVTNGTTYYYVVSAVNSFGQSANSSQVSATPSSGSGGMTFSNGTFTNNSVLSLAGTEVYGVGLGNSSSETTANGYTFSSYPNSNLTYGGSSDGAYSGFIANGATSGDANFNSVLNDAELGINSGSITLNNLTSGTTYKVLFLVVDTRTGSGTRTFKIESGSNSSPSQSFAFVGGTPSLGGYVYCTFTASGTTQTFTNFQGIYGSDYGYQLNGVLVGK